MNSSQEFDELIKLMQVDFFYYNVSEQSEKTIFNLIYITTITISNQK
jgi:hypothetical protein